jgi:hypothetical protein
MSYSKTSVLERAPEWHRADKTSLVDFNEDGGFAVGAGFVFTPLRDYKIRRFDLVGYVASQS